MGLNVMFFCYMIKTLHWTDAFFMEGMSYDC